MDELVLFEGDNMTHSDRLSISIWVSPAVESSRVETGLAQRGAIMIVSKQTYTLFTLKGSYV